MKIQLTKPFIFLWHHKVLSLIGLVVIGGIAGFILINRGKKEAYDEYTVQPGTVAVAVEASGKVKAKKSATMYFANAAKVTWVGVKKGDQVRVGQVVATLDRRQLEKIISQKLSEYKTARWDLEQSYDDNNVAGKPLDNVGLLSDSEKRIIQKYQFTMDNSVWDVEIATLALEQSVMTSPVSGTVVDDGGFIQGELLTSKDIANRSMRVVDLSSIYFQADVDESEYAAIHEGIPATIELDAFPDASLSGIVTYVGKEGVKKTGGGIQIPVDITFNETDVPLVPELSGDVEMITQEKQDVLVIAKKYARKSNGQYVVDILRNGKKQEQSVDIGLVGLSTLEIRGGLAQGDVIVIPKEKAQTPGASSEHSMQ